MILWELKEDEINLIPGLNFYEVWLYIHSYMYNFLKLMKKKGCKFTSSGCSELPWFTSRPSMYVCRRDLTGWRVLLRMTFHIHPPPDQAVQSSETATMEFYEFNKSMRKSWGASDDRIHADFGRSSFLTAILKQRKPCPIDYGGTQGKDVIMGSQAFATKGIKPMHRTRRNLRLYGHRYDTVVTWEDQKGVPYHVRYYILMSATTYLCTIFF